MMLFLIRHGETDWNRQGRRQGRIDIPLNEAERQQLQRCGEALQGLQIQSMISSPLSRATESAQILAAALGFDPTRIQTDDALIERDFGDIDGMTAAELRAHRASGGADRCEPLSALRARTMAAVRRYSAADRSLPVHSRNVILISHSAAIKSVFVQLYGKPEIQRYQTHNAGVSIISVVHNKMLPLAFDLPPDQARIFLRRQNLIQG